MARRDVDSGCDRRLCRTPPAMGFLVASFLLRGARVLILAPLATCRRVSLPAPAPQVRLVDEPAVSDRVPAPAPTVSR